MEAGSAKIPPTNPTRLRTVQILRSPERASLPLSLCLSLSLSLTSLRRLSLSFSSIHIVVSCICRSDLDQQYPVTDLRFSIASHDGEFYNKAFSIPLPSADAFRKETSRFLGGYSPSFEGTLLHLVAGGPPRGPVER